MRTSGPPPEPTKLKLIKGTLRKGRMKNEATPENAIPPIPEQLSGEAKAEWNRISEELMKLGLLSRVDRAALAGYCEAWADWLDATDRVNRFGKVIKTGEKTVQKLDGSIERSGGNMIENPYFSVKKRSAELMHKFLTEFGMTPASRSRINATPQDDAKSPDWKGFGS